MLAAAALEVGLTYGLNQLDGCNPYWEAPEAIALTDAVDPVPAYHVLKVANYSYGIVNFGI